MSSDVPVPHQRHVSHVKITSRSVHSSSSVLIEEKSSAQHRRPFQHCCAVADTCATQLAVSR
eukprot:17445-Heterococcus_DN1.PRE.5